MSALESQQRALLDALFAWPCADAVQHLRAYATGVGSLPGRGLLVYQANGHMLAERALRAAYPVLLQMLGDESFGDLARAFWHAQPPRHGDIAQWGGGIADFVRQSMQLQDEPYLGDMAEVEWAMHCCAAAADRVADLGTLALLTTCDANTLTLQLAPGCFCFGSPWPVGSILLAHLEGNPSFAEVGDQIRSRTAQEVVIWRTGLKPQARVAVPGEVTLLHALLEGLALEPALESAGGLDFSQWLPLAVQTGLVQGVAPLSSNFKQVQP